MAERDTRRTAARRSRSEATRKTKAWLPDASSVVGEKALISPKGRKYRVLTTTELDPYDRPEKDGEQKKGGS
ncbi:MAG: hypothetical protein WA418_03345 [Bradyrhizobium sp.]